MAKTYSQMQEQIAKLQREADALRKKEVGGVVARIKEAIKHYELTAIRRLSRGNGATVSGPERGTADTCGCDHAPPSDR